LGELGRIFGMGFESGDIGKIWQVPVLRSTGNTVLRLATLLED
jgi:hypothetical protein